GHRAVSQACGPSHGGAKADPVSSRPADSSLPTMPECVRAGNSVLITNFPQSEDVMKIDASISAVITGGASGLGAAVARRLAGQGAKVALFDLNQEAGEALAAELGGVFCKVNVTDDEQVDAAFAKA